MRILVADSDADRGTRIARACSAEGHSVERVTHGAAALEFALERLPEVVVCPVDLAVIDAIRLAEILRSNPRTRGASFLFLAKDELDRPMPMHPHDVAIVAPWRQETILEHIAAVERRRTRFAESRPGTEIEGQLGAMPVADLLQFFQMNRRTGTLRIGHDAAGGATDSILLHRGSAVDARVLLAGGGSIVGEKAFYRILGRSEGRFEFRPTDVPAAGRIRKPMRALLLEGLRQLDEWRRRHSELPAAETRLRLRIERDRIPANVHSLTREVINAVESLGRVEDVVDHCSFPDYQVLRVLADLLRYGAFAVCPSVPVTDGAPGAEGQLFGSEQVARLQEWAAAQRPPPGGLLKLLVLSVGSEPLAGFVRVLSLCPGFRPSPRVGQGAKGAAGLAELGRIPLDAGIGLRVVALSDEPAYRPLFDVVAHGSLGGILLPGGLDDAAQDAAAELRGELARVCPGVRVVQVLEESAAEGLDEADRKERITRAGSAVLFLPADPPDGPASAAALLREVLGEILA